MTIDRALNQAAHLLLLVFSRPLLLGEGLSAASASAAAAALLASARHITSTSSTSATSEPAGPGTEYLSCTQHNQPRVQQHDAQPTHSLMRFHSAPRASGSAFSPIILLSATAAICPPPAAAADAADDAWGCSRLFCISTCIRPGKILQVFRRASPSTQPTSRWHQAAGGSHRQVTAVSQYNS